jgi:hypothetical protein
MTCDKSRFSGSPRRRRFAALHLAAFGIADRGGRPDVPAFFSAISPDSNNPTGPVSVMPRPCRNLIPLGAVGLDQRHRRCRTGSNPTFPRLIGRCSAWFGPLPYFCRCRSRKPARQPGRPVEPARRTSIASARPALTDGGALGQNFLSMRGARRGCLRKQAHDG